MAEIVFAGYGVLNRTNDVTSKVKQQYRDGMRKFVGNDTDYGDPAPTIQKYLYIIWDDGARGRGSAVSLEQGQQAVVVP